MTLTLAKWKKGETYLKLTSQMWSSDGRIPISSSSMNVIICKCIIILLYTKYSCVLAVHKFTWWNRVRRRVRLFLFLSFSLVATRCRWQLDRHGGRCQMDPDGHRLASTMVRQGEGWAPVMRHVLRAHACDPVSGLRTCSLPRNGYTFWIDLCF